MHSLMVHKLVFFFLQKNETKGRQISDATLAVNELELENAYDLGLLLDMLKMMNF